MYNPDMTTTYVSQAVHDLIRLALAEDIGSGDKTTDFLVDHSQKGKAGIIAKQDLVLAGLHLVQQVYALVNPDIVMSASKANGAFVAAGDKIAELHGPFHALLTGERTALNFLQRLSGIATLTRAYVTKTALSKAVLLDTRKTTPGWRTLEKGAVCMGGAVNHRMGLFDGVLIKENHIAACGGVAAAVAKAQSQKCPHLSIEVEVRSLDELREALIAAPDIIMLDNMSCDEMREAVRIAGGKIPLEASGNVSLETVADIAATGVDYISVGAITHSAPAVDISMLIGPE